MKEHAAPAAIAAVVGGLAGFGSQQATAPNAIEKTVHVTVAASKHAWPSLDEKQVAALAERIKAFAGAKVMVFCDGADCRDLQTDIDDAFEAAGAKSERALPMNALGYGLAVFAPENDPRGKQLADALREVSGGVLVAELRSSGDLVGVVIGKRPRS